MLKLPVGTQVKAEPIFGPQMLGEVRGYAELKCGSLFVEHYVLRLPTGGHLLVTEEEVLEYTLPQRQGEVSLFDYSGI